MIQSKHKEWTTPRLLVVIGLLAVISGALVGTGIAYGFHYEAPTTREIYLFTASMGFNESIVWPGVGQIPHDSFSPDHITVNKGDHVIIHYINTDDTDSHNFFMAAPYNFDLTLQPGQTANINFTASYAGVFAYKCMIHQPTMTGYLTVIG